MRITRLIFVTIIISSVLAIGLSAKEGAGPSGMEFLTGYFGSKGPVVNQDEDGTRLNFDVAGFYKDMMKVGGDLDVVEECKQADDFQACIEERSLSMESRNTYEQNMKNIQSAVDIAQQHGIDYGSVPFVQDLLSE